MGNEGQFKCFIFLHRVAKEKAVKQTCHEFLQITKTFD